jgi:hypothetical protein
MKVHVIFLLLVFICFISSCASTVKSPVEYKGKQLISGEGGGFSGIEYSYILLENGQMFSQLGAREEFTNLGRLDSKLTKQLYLLADQFDVDTEVINAPGNRYRFLEWSSGVKRVRNVWNPDQDTYPKEWNELSKMIIAIGNDRTQNTQ